MGNKNLWLLEGEGLLATGPYAAESKPKQPNPSLAFPPPPP